MTRVTRNLMVRSMRITLRYGQTDNGQQEEGYCILEQHSWYWLGSDELLAEKWLNIARAASPSS